MLMSEIGSVTIYHLYIKHLDKTQNGQGQLMNLITFFGCRTEPAR